MMPASYINQKNKHLKQQNKVITLFIKGILNLLSWYQQNAKAQNLSNLLAMKKLKHLNIELTTLEIKSTALIKRSYQFVK